MPLLLATRSLWGALRRLWEYLKEHHAALNTVATLILGCAAALMARQVNQITANQRDIERLQYLPLFSFRSPAWGWQARASAVHDTLLILNEGARVRHLRIRVWSFLQV